ncbi:hypothetical protein KIN20_016928 [Parelaphostrongylus tenuis]|uniref:Uncharacterized protein n=1 Tax=Parelaphostrongylus tenuis TaxID=148309 RepID=A0AAD5MHZ1_PARTN|nr:hypothetical protein KIN20_016928 [Parelaphostrongylus tenuis]
MFLPRKPETALDKWQSLRGSNAQEPSPAQEKVNTRDFVTAQLHLTFDNISNSQLCDSEVLEALRIERSDSLEFGHNRLLRLRSGASICRVPALVRCTAHECSVKNVSANLCACQSVRGFFDGFYGVSKQNFHFPPSSAQLLFNAFFQNCKKIRLGQHTTTFMTRARFLAVETISKVEETWCSLPKFSKGNNDDCEAVMMEEHSYAGSHHYEHELAPASDLGDIRQYVPPWAVWLFAACFLLIVVVLLLDYCVTRRNALGNTCCTRSRQKRNIATSTHQKRSTNMLLNKLNRQGQYADQDV